MVQRTSEPGGDALNKVRSVLLGHTVAMANTWVLEHCDADASTEASAEGIEYIKMLADRGVLDEFEHSEDAIDANQFPSPSDLESVESVIQRCRQILAAR